MSNQSIHRKLPQGAIAITIGDLNTKVGSGNTLLGYVVGKLGLGDRNGDGRKFVNFFNVHCLVIDDTLLEHRAWFQFNVGRKS